MRFRLYTKADCPYCHMAMRLLAENRKEFECYSLDDQPTLLREIQGTYKWDTVPIVVEVTAGNERFIGGYTDLKEYLSTGKQILKG